jgi:hypothetical protein
MKCLFGYMVLSSAALLGLLGSVITMVAIEKYKIIMDLITFYFLLFNFAIVGCIAIFFPKGIPAYITQSYLVATSIILAWQLSQFNDWTAWCLLVLLALYDLCAVLTPCGPLKALIGLMSKDGAPSLPGLLYEARLPDGVERPRNNNQRQSNDNSNSAGGEDQEESGLRSSSQNKHTKQVEQQQPLQQEPSMQQTTATATQGVVHATSRQRRSTNNRNPGPTGLLPLAIALIYKLPILSPPQFSSTQNESIMRRSQFTSQQLKSNVVVQFPRSGGYIYVDTPNDGEDEEQQPNPSTRWSFLKRKKKKKEKTRYIAFDRNNNVKRVLILDRDGSVFEELDDGGEGSGNGLESNSIKLGLVRLLFVGYYERTILFQDIQNHFVSLHIG